MNVDPCPQPERSYSSWPGFSVHFTKMILAVYLCCAGEPELEHPDRTAPLANSHSLHHSHGRQSRLPRSVGTCPQDPEPQLFDSLNQGCGSGSAWICILFRSRIRIHIQYADPDPGGKFFKIKTKNARKLVIIAILFKIKKIK